MTRLIRTGDERTRGRARTRTTLFNEPVTRIDVIIPLRDAAALLPGCLEAIRAQTLSPGRIHLVVGPSRDATLEIARSAWSRDSRVLVSENPAGDRGSALNVALAALGPETEAVAMVDAQSRIDPAYLERSAAVLDETGAAVVGGSMQPVGTSPMGEAIAAALSSPSVSAIRASISRVRREMSTPSTWASTAGRSSTRWGRTTRGCCGPRTTT